MAGSKWEVASGEYRGEKLFLKITFQNTTGWQEMASDE
jgi:hypothetical protein